MASDRQHVTLSVQALVARLIRLRVPLLIVSLALTVTAVPWAAQLEFDQRIESLYAENDPILADFLRSHRWFGGDEFAILAFEQPDLFAENGAELTDSSRKALADLVEQVNRIPGVNPDSTQDLASSMKFRFGRKRVREMLEGILVGRDGKTTAIVARLIPQNETQIPRGATIAALRQLSNAQKSEIFIVGEPVQIHDMFSYVEEDGHSLFLLSTALLSCVLLIIFRSLRWVILPLCVVFIAIVWTQAILVFFNVRLSMVSSMLNSLVTIISVATVTHVSVHYRELRQEYDRVEALRITFQDLLPAVFWTCSTTAVGFAALTISSLTPVQSFGLMMALATLLVLLTTAIVLPAGILVGRFQQDPRSAPGEQHLQQGLGWLATWVEHHPRSLGCCLAVTMILAGLGLFRLRVETNFSKNFRADSPIVRSLDFFENRLGGAGTWEVNFPAPSQLTSEFLDQVRQLTVDIRQLRGDGEAQVTKVVSLTDGIDLIPAIPLLIRNVDDKLQMLDRLQGEFVSSLYNADMGRMRIVLRAREQQTAEKKNALIGQVSSLVNRRFPDNGNQAQAARATGTFVLLTFLIDSLMSDQIWSFGLASLGIFLMMTIAFGCWRIGLASLIPNMFPIVMLLGTMGWIGLRINIATAMIASVSMGLTVDCSIHYLCGYRRCRQRGLSRSDALRETHQAVGRALFLSNLVLIAGFTALTASHFIPLVYFGILVSVAICGGLLGNLILMPLLICFVERETAPPGSMAAETT